MPDIEGISGVAITNVEAISGKGIANLNAFGGVAKAASGPGFKTTDLEIWWRAEDGPMNNPSLIGSGIDIENLANTNGYSSQSIQGDHRLLNGSSSNWTTTGGVDAILLDGVNDNIITRQLYLGASPYNDPFSENLGTSNIYYNSWDTLDSYATEVWVKAFNANGTWSSETNIFSAYMNDGFRMRLSGSSGQITFPSVQNTSNQQGSYTPSPAVYVGADGIWHQICFVVDDVNGTMKTYIDGSLEDTRSFYIGFDSWIYNSMVIGAYRTSGSEAKKFYVGEYRMYSSLLSDSEVLANYNARKTHYGIT